MNSRVRQSHARWPFWLLLAAWFCANCPQGAVYRVVTWIEEARSFSHQRTLTREVAFLLGGEKTPERFAVPDEVESKRPQQPAGEVESVKKIELAIERSNEAEKPKARRFDWARTNILVGEHLKPTPPHGPPRVAGLS